MKQPLYAHVAREVAQGISSGRFPVGTLLPSEAALCGQFGTSRHTVREALRELVDLGLVSRRNGVGTLVMARTAGKVQVASMASLKDQQAFLAVHPRIVKKSENIVADQALAKALGVAAGSRWLHIACLRAGASGDEPPACWSDHYLPPSYTEMRKLLRQQPTVMMRDIIARHYGRRCTEIQHEITPVALDAPMATELRARPGSPALKMVWRYLDRSGKIILVDVGIHPEGRVRYSTVIRP